ncbi:MAG: hypothetical protein H6559_10490 [Lewinellaceae bacterium]|nr:hypothetical protein [Lewinellaceae bacterium]
MKKKFNITWVCYPSMHYMMDTSQKMKEIMAMVEGGEYFIINRPRQYGKTTALFKVRMSFNPAEIAPMLKDYSKAEGVSMDIPVLSEQLYYYTSGYPFLVSKLCETISEDILPGKAEKNGRSTYWKKPSNCF